MIRSYTVDELQMMSGFTRRTISDYVSKGLLAGPSHRGRGARYSQADADALRVVPKIRTLMKKEFPTVDSVASFLRVISQQELRDLACQPSEKELDLEVRRIRVRVSMATVLPSLAPERLTQVVDSLSPQQICGIDKGQYQLGAILDLSELFRESSGEVETTQRYSLAAQTPSVYAKSGQQLGAAKSDRGYDNDSLESDRGYEDVSLRESPFQDTAGPVDRRKLQSRLRLVKPSQSVEQPDSEQQTKLLRDEGRDLLIDMRLGDIADRLKRLEKLLQES
jgi:hypothetical protein